MPETVRNKDLNLHLRYRRPRHDSKELILTVSKGKNTVQLEIKRNNLGKGTDLVKAFLCVCSCLFFFLLFKMK